MTIKNKLLNDLKLISISGCGHSGTTLTATVLGAHKNLLLIPNETRMFIDENYDINNFIFNNYTNEKTAIVEKTPNHVYVLDKIKLTYPETKFILNIRDPRDIAASLYNRFDDWQKSLDRLKKDFEYVKKFYNQSHVIKYEDIVYNFENTFIDVCKYLNIDFDKNILTYYNFSPNWFNVENPKKTDGKDKNYINNISNHEIRRSWQVKQPIFDGTGRWKKDLNNSQLEDIKKNVGELASFFGYTI